MASRKPKRRAPAKKITAQVVTPPPSKPTWAEVVAQYCADVQSGAQPACKTIKQAVTRYLNDRRTAAQRGIVFDEESANHALDFYSFTRHSKGKWAGQVFEPSPWQVFIDWNLFGFKWAATGLRRFRIGFIMIPRKNGKSTQAAKTGLYLAFADGEPGAEVYSAATKRDQAKIVHEEAKRMVRQSPELRDEFAVFRDNIHHDATASKFEPLGADEDSLDGLNVSAAIVDELHAHKTRGVWDVLDTATGSREQPLIFAITTAGVYDPHSVCWEQFEYAQQVLTGVIVDDTFFAFVATPDEEDKERWDREENWAKVNPNLNVSVRLDDLRAKAAKAKASPAAQNAFRQKHLDEWTQQTTRWIDLDTWDRCGKPLDLATLKHRSCHAGLDLSSTTDLTAKVLVFSPLEEGGDFILLAKFYLPEATLEKLEQKLKTDKKVKVPYRQWVDAGYVTLTPGNVVDYDFVRQDFNNDASDYDVKEIAYDRWGALQLSTQLQDDGFTVVPFGQGYAGMAGPIKEFETLLLGARLNHLNNPVLRWMAGNMVVRRDPAGNLKPDKEKATQLIDGIVASIMGVGRATAQPAVVLSVYEKRGLRTL